MITFKHKNSNWIRNQDFPPKTSDSVTRFKFSVFVQHVLHDIQEANVQTNLSKTLGINEQLHHKVHRWNPLESIESPRTGISTWVALFGPLFTSSPSGVVHLNCCVIHYWSMPKNLTWKSHTPLLSYFFPHLVAVDV